jgi:hypothetical protein
MPEHEARSTSGKSESEIRRGFRQSAGALPWRKIFRLMRDSDFTPGRINA